VCWPAIVYELQEVEQILITHQGVCSSYLLLRKLLLNKRLFDSKDCWTEDR
jgi:hypothetical protein